MGAYIFIQRRSKVNPDTNEDIEEHTKKLLQLLAIPPAPVDTPLPLSKAQAYEDLQQASKQVQQVLQVQVSTSNTYKLTCGEAMLTPCDTM